MNSAEIPLDYLYFVVYLNDHKKNVVIPDFWCESLDLANAINNGLNSHDNHRIFFSADINKDPDFSIAVSETFDEKVDGCYFGKLCRAFNTKAEADAFKSTHRAVVPGVYNMKKSGGRTTEQSKLLTTKEFNVAMEQGRTAMNTRFVVKTEKFCEEISDLRHRIVNYNANNGDEGLDDSDIEHLQEEIDDDNDSQVEFDLLLPKPQIVMKIEHDSNEKANEEANQATNDEMDTPNGNIENVQVDDVLLVGNINYEKNAANDFHFPEFQTTIRSSIAVVLRAWNTNVPFKFYIYDKKFIGVLIREVMLTHMGNTEEGMDEKGIAFIKRLFEIRVDGDEGRLSTFDESFKEKFEYQMEKMSRRRK